MEQTYVGTELELFQHAVHWKDYLKKEISPHLHGHILEMGAGLGANTKLFSKSNPKIESWTCVEPDPKLAEQIQKASSPPIEVLVGTLQTLKMEKTFDSILYIDVLEHIEKDHEELQKILPHLSPGGKLIILSPAHQFLFSPFDKKIGHFRRYNKKTLLAAVPAEIKLCSLEYLDSIGFFASLANRFLLKAADPTQNQILFWDNFLVRASSYLDPLLRNKMGKSILGIWRKES